MRIYLLLLAALTAFGLSTVFAQEPPPARVVVAAVGQEEVAANQAFSGQLYYERVSQVSSEIPGLVETIAVREGDLVKAAAPLVQLNTDLLAKEIAAARIRLDQIDLGIRHARKNLTRLEDLYAQAGVSEKDYEDALYIYEDNLKARQTAETDLETLLLRQDKSLIKAPFAGVILEKNVDAGNWVQQGDKLVSLGATADLFVKVAVAETLLRHVTIGAPVPVLITAFQRELTGTIDDIAPVADSRTKNVFLKIRLPAWPEAVANLSATVYVPTGPRQRLSIIPRDALVRFQGRDFVYTVAAGQATLQPVNIVTYLGDRLGVDSADFTTDLPVVVEGNERLQPGQPVTIVGER